MRDRNGEAILIQENPQVSEESILFNEWGKVIRNDQMWGSREALFASSNLRHTKDRKRRYLSDKDAVRYPTTRQPVAFGEAI